MCKWNKAKILNFKTYRGNRRNCDRIRMSNRKKNLTIKNGGWHLSFFGNNKFIQNKINNYAHQEYNTQEVKNNVDNNMKNGVGLFTNEKLTFIHIKDNNNLPINYKMLINLK